MGTGPFFGRKSCLAKKNVGRKQGSVPFPAQTGTVPFSRRERQFSRDLHSAAKIGTVPYERLRISGDWRQKRLLARTLTIRCTAAQGHKNAGANARLTKCNLSSLRVFTTKARISANSADWLFHHKLYQSRPPYSAGGRRTTRHRLPEFVDCRWFPAKTLDGRTGATCCIFLATSIKIDDGVAEGERYLVRAIAPTRDVSCRCPRVILQYCCFRVGVCA